MEWRYYEHMMLPICAPNEIVDSSDVEKRDFFKTDRGIPILARWTSDWDCGNVTKWWYIVKDTPFDIQQLKSNRRYNINKGLKNFVICELDSSKHANDMIDVMEEAYKSYPESYRPSINRDSLKKSFVANSGGRKYFGAFDKEGTLQGWLSIKYYIDYCEFDSLKVNPSYEKLQINAALIAKVLESLELSKEYFLCSGERNISHKTHFDEYLEKNFGFRKAYCKLNVKYRFPIGFIIKLIFPFRGVLEKLDNNRLIHSLNAVLKMEEATR